MRGGVCVAWLVVFAWWSWIVGDAAPHRVPPGTPCDASGGPFVAPDRSVRAFWPDGAAHGAGGVAVWLVAGEEGMAVLAARADSLGRADGAPDTVVTSRTLGAPSVAIDRDGGLVVVERVAGARSELLVRGLAADGRPAGPIRTLSAEAAATLPRTPRVVVFSRARDEPTFLVVWTDWLPGASVRAVWCDASAEPRGAPFTLRSAADGSSGAAACAVRGDAALVAWIDGSWPARVRAAPLARGGTVLGDAFEVSDPSRVARRAGVRFARGAGLAGAPSHAPLPHGRGGRTPVHRALLLWSEGREGTSRALCRFVTIGRTASAEIALDGGSTAHELSPAAALGTDGEAFCLWERGPMLVGRWIAADADRSLSTVVTLSADSRFVPRQASAAPLASTGAAWALWTQGEPRTRDDWSVPTAAVVCPPASNRRAPDQSVRTVAREPHGPPQLSVRFTSGARGGAVVASGPPGESAELRLYDVAGRAMGPSVRVRFEGAPLTIALARLAGRARPRTSAACLAVLRGRDGRAVCRAVLVGGR